MTPDDLRIRRNALHLSQKQLAEVLGVSTSTVSHWEQDVQKIPAYLDLALQTLERKDDDVITLAVVWTRKTDGSAIPVHVTLDLREARHFAKGALGWVETYTVPSPAKEAP